VSERWEGYGLFSPSGELVVVKIFRDQWGYKNWAWWDHAEMDMHEAERDGWRVASVEIRENSSGNPAGHAMEIL
jgi:hypothetical protein